MQRSAAGLHASATIDAGIPGLLARLKDLLPITTPPRMTATPSDKRSSQPGRGSVALVGAGPGDPELLTVRAVRLISCADALVYDHLVAADILEITRPEAERIYVGKEAGNHTLPQDEINRLLVSLAREGKRVVRLKGGDPFVFGRGGEELEELVEAGIDFEVVPGITAACGVAAYSGIPLTHRDHAQSVVFATGHFKDGSTQLDWSALARPRQTVVIYMGVGALPGICGELISHGLSPLTPAALVQNGTTRTQRSLTSTLVDLPEAAKAAGISPPALLIVGEVVTLRERLDWFERKVEAQI